MNFLLILWIFSVFYVNGRNSRIVLGYNPMRPFYHPRPDHLVSQIVPPGQPWPARPEDYASFSQTTSTINIKDKTKETTVSTQSVPPVSVVFQSTPSTNLEDRIKENISLVQSGRPPFHPNPGSVVTQIVPPGLPWPARPEDYANFSQTTSTINIKNKTKENTVSTQSVPPVPVVFQSTPSTNLEDRNKENTPLAQSGRPPFHPNPGSVVTQIVPPGQPWPARPEDYASFSQTTPSINLQSKFLEPNPLVPEVPWERPLHPNSGNVVTQMGNLDQSLPAKPEHYENSSEKTTSQSGHEYSENSTNFNNESTEKIFISLLKQSTISDQNDIILSKKQITLNNKKKVVLTNLLLDNIKEYEPNGILVPFWLRPEN